MAGSLRSRSSIGYSRGYTMAIPKGSYVPSADYRSDRALIRVEDARRGVETH
jgi:hypothetical protein